MRSRFVLVTACSCATLALAACGGGVSFGFGDAFDDPPDVNMTTSVDSAHAGDTVRLAAAASDDFGIDRVEFFRVESDGTATRLATDKSAPYQFDTTMPDTTDQSVDYFARAVDDIGQASDSRRVSVSVLP